MLARAWRWFIGPLTFDEQVCGHSDRRVLTRDQARRFERRLMAAWVGDFIAALRQDLIGVDDFERSTSA